VAFLLAMLFYAPQRCPPRPRQANPLLGQLNMALEALHFDGAPLIVPATRDTGRFLDALREPFSQPWCERASTLKIMLGTRAQCPRTRRNARAAWLLQDARIMSARRRRGHLRRRCRSRPRTQLQVEFRLGWARTTHKPSRVRWIALNCNFFVINVDARGGDDRDVLRVDETILMIFFSNQDPSSMYGSDP